MMNVPFTSTLSRHNDEELIVLECFSVQEEGVFNVYVYEIQYDQVQEFTQINLDSVVIDKTPSEIVMLSLNSTSHVVIHNHVN